MKRIGSSPFNDKVVQKVQMIDPNDVGRAPIEFGYKKLKSAFERRFQKRVEREIAELTRKGIKESTKATAKSGTKKGAKKGARRGAEELRHSRDKGRFNSRYLDSYQVLKEHDAMNVAVMFQFNKLNTQARFLKSSKNYGGKKPIIANITRGRLDRIIEGGTDY